MSPDRMFYKRNNQSKIYIFFVCYCLRHTSLISVAYAGSFGPKSQSCSSNDRLVSKKIKLLTPSQELHLFFIPRNQMYL